MLDQIQEVIRKNLPAEVGEQLRKHLAEAEKTAQKLTLTLSDLDSSVAMARQLQATVADLQAKLKLAGDLDAREKAVTKREDRLDMTIASTKMAGLEANLHSIKELAAIAFKSPRMIKETYETASKGIVQNGYTTGGTVTESKSTMETIKDESNP